MLTVNSAPDDQVNSNFQPPANYASILCRSSRQLQERTFILSSVASHDQGIIREASTPTLRGAKGSTRSTSALRRIQDWNRSAFLLAEALRRVRRRITKSLSLVHVPHTVLPTLRHITSPDEPLARASDTAGYRVILYSRSAHIPSLAIIGIFDESNLSSELEETGAAQFDANSLKHTLTCGGIGLSDSDKITNWAIKAQKGKGSLIY